MSCSPEDLRVIIPVGGMATRLLPLTAGVSKAYLRLLNRPLIEISLLCLAKQGVKNFIFGVKGYTNYRCLHDYFESGVGFSARYGIVPRIHIKYQPNVEDHGSADSARINMEYYDVKDSVFAVQGDNIFDIDLRDLLESHREKGALMTIGLRPVEDVEGYGIADVDKEMRISRFVEKPSKEEAPSKLANTGLYFVTPDIRKIFKERSIRDMISKKKRLDFGYDLIPYLIETGRSMYGYVLSGCWYDVGTPQRYLEAMSGILHGQLASLRDFGGRISEDATVWVQGESPESMKRRERILKKFKQGKIEFDGPVLIGRHCQIEDGARIVNSCIDNYTKVGRNVTIEGSAVMDRAIIGDGAEIRESIVGRHTTVNSALSSPTRVSSVSVVAHDVTVEAGCQLRATRVYPHTYLPRGDYGKVTIRR